jgi:hypothetical protein
VSHKLSLKIRIDVAKLPSQTRHPPPQAVVDAKPVELRGVVGPGLRRATNSRHGDKDPARQAELASATPRRGTPIQSPASVSVIECLRTTKGTQAEASASRVRRIRRGARQSLPRRERTSQVQGMNEGEAEDIDQSSDEEDNATIVRERAARGLQVKFPMEEEFQAGYIWGYDAMFNASIDNIHAVKNVETNHRCLSQQRVREMYWRLAGNEASLVTPLIL